MRHRRAFPAAAQRRENLLRKNERQRSRRRERDRRDRARAAFGSGDDDDVGLGFGNACGYCAHAALGHKFHADFGARVHVLEVED